ncbi:hypothetical protein IL38_24310 [Actinopolyspora erythraea]|jgi:hypothetical protein|uniref:Uncharacterized protein n=1 Tax=Actinopolyspora erythraea TaxID=414996 RepID=A0ABR4WYA1_9ACTN|nr:hypothetical protein [Actinopolyspora erythraea]KGI79306.1 hypothetical protein IL38_24310 [Actinopolyspora erythraea]
MTEDTVTVEQEGQDRPKRSQRGRRTSSAAKQHLRQLRNAKKELDSERAERERREDAALSRYAEAAARVEVIEQQRRQKVEDLERQITETNEKAQVQVSETESEKLAALRELNELGRSAEELSRLFEIPVKRVRSMLRDQKSTRQSTTAPTDEEEQVQSGDAVGQPAIG